MQTIYNQHHQCVLEGRLINKTSYLKKNLKQSWLPVFWKKIKNTQGTKENAFQLDQTGQNVQILEEVLIFHVPYNIKTGKETIKSLSLCQLDAGRLVEGKGHETD